MIMIVLKMSTVCSHIARFITSVHLYAIAYVFTCIFDWCLSVVFVLHMYIAYCMSFTLLQNSVGNCTAWLFCYFAETVMWMFDIS